MKQKHSDLGAIVWYRDARKVDVQSTSFPSYTLLVRGFALIGTEPNQKKKKPA
jgi:hypothetical protein